MPVFVLDFKHLGYKMDEKRIFEHEALKSKHSTLENKLSAVENDYACLKKRTRGVEEETPHGIFRVGWS